MQSQPDSADTTANQGRQSRWSSLWWFLAILTTGALLWWIGGMPPLAWREVAQVLKDITTTRPQFPILLAQGAFLLAAWGLLLLLAVRVIARVFQPRSGSASRHPHSEQKPQAPQVRPEALDTQKSPSRHTRPDNVSMSRPPPMTRATGSSPAQEDHAPDSSRPLQQEDFLHPLPVWSTPSSLFGKPLQVIAASYSDEGVQHVPATKSYLLIDLPGKNDATHPLPLSMVASVDHLPAEEPGYTTSCRAIASLKEMVLRAWMDCHDVSEEALAALFTEQVQKVWRVIGQESQGDETLLAMAVVLIVGSTMFVEKMGETRVYLCHAQEGFSQVTQTLPVIRPLKAGTSTASGFHAQQTRSKKHNRDSGSASVFQHSPKAMSLFAGDRILLCSDGVWSVLHASYLEHIIRSAGPEPADVCTTLLQAARKSGSTDPVSIIAIHCQEAKAFLP